MSKISIAYIAILILLFACKKKKDEINPDNQCKMPTEVAVQLVTGDSLSISLVGTDSMSLKKVTWMLTSYDTTLAYITPGITILKVPNISRNGQVKVSVDIETSCRTKITLTRTENIQSASFRKIWLREIGEYTDTTFTALVEATTGGCIAVGTDYSLKVISVDASGKILWRKEIVDSEYQKVRSIVKADDGGYVLGGDRVGREYTYGLMKISESGEKQWQKIFKGRGNTFSDQSYDRLAQVINASDGGYIVAGYSSSLAGFDKTDAPKNPKASQNYTLTDYWIVKVDAQGKIVWDKTIGGDGQEILNKIVVTVDGGYMISGYSESSISDDKTSDVEGNFDTWVVKINKSGTKQWDRSFVNSAFDMVALQDGSVVLSIWPKGGSKSFGLMKLDDRGNSVWQKNVEGDYGNLLPLDDGGFIMAGRFGNSNLLRFSPDGEALVASTVDLSGSYFSFWAGLAKAKSGGFYGIVSSRPGQGIYQPAVIYLK
ncbi:hypothetical protein SAMN05216327_11890 [Dyadobacter sp. SG02]|uniref:hypothetical protein n=1 Tax=Dyadobacter sp. SG02 TaxID=1855291 RepID=UPI0008B69B03|nr:hypothetical protein [Dyadobacter sp. SG02]SEJ75179.1 hypothetical protein SAMN05216327_11890 [Dyadobacter sp. SG02]